MMSKTNHYNQRSELSPPEIKYIPKDTRERIPEIINQNNILNFYLALNKYIFESTSGRDKKLSFYNSKRVLTNKSGLPEGHELLNKCLSGIKNFIKNRNDSLIEKELTNDWNLAIGLGGASVYETGLTLHHIYGVPYLPASSLKGVVRSYALQTKFLDKVDNNSKHFDLDLEIEAEKDLGFKTIFGTQKSAGKVIFYDAYPAEKPNIIADVMNPHYPDYYGSSGKKEAYDFDKPNPVFFLVLKETKFTFLCSVNKTEDKEIASGVWAGNKISRVVADLLTSALTEHGIGAKTAVGYGYFRE